jgi:hypothetical protein
MMENQKINIIEGFLSEDECKEIIITHKNGELLNSYYVTEKITKILDDNFKFKGYKLSELSPIIFKEYTPKTKYTLKWKVKNSTYFTIIVQLNDDFKNGYQQFLVDDDENYYQVPKFVGSLVFFFSNMKHRIAPVRMSSKYVLECEVKLVKDENFKKTLL